MARSPGRIHFPSVLFGAFWTAVGLLLLNQFLGPILARRALPPEEQTLASVHRTVRNNAVLAADPMDLMRAGAKAMLESLKDPYASWVGPEDLRTFEEESTGTYLGIGAMLHPDGRVIYPFEDGPAAAAGVRIGDRILSVDGEDTAALGSDALSTRLRGPRGSLARLELLHVDGSRAQVEVQRRALPAGTVGDLRWMDREAGIAHVHVRSFAQTTARELDHACDQLTAESPVRGLILDLRWNIGGQLESAVEIAARFLEGQVVCTLRDRQGKTSSRYADAKLTRWPDLPVVILVNGLSASGSEVLAGALRDHGAAVLVGERTYGKGIYQEVYSFRDGGFVLKFTAGVYLTPAGRSLEGHLDPQMAPGGLEPDLRISSDPESAQAIRRWLQTNRPPERLRAEVEAAFPDHFTTQAPPDAAAEAALALLQHTLADA
jgi:carboxyl-terminal processing protease